ncbi:glycosyl hydrolase [Duganella sp. BJB1802]|uniref:WD40/YVTN/BNR-like repeat-containing protein n=1 Tax=Duganella sp. BJB1802 TaxID=2744575 RepID=UPI00159468DB|nr:glycosyl hydrolase [Duganella sp. BJB1802]NVD69597.1 glycosyl hydrolase [Duganella sp. BJB1802]
MKPATQTLDPGRRCTALARRAGAALMVLCALGAGSAGAASGGQGAGPDPRLDQAAAPALRPAQSAMLAVGLAGTRVVAAGERGIILHSDDCGGTWRQARVPASVTLTALYFIDERQGWAIGHGGIVLVTRDAGATWQKQLDGLAIAKLALASAQERMRGENTPDAQRALSDAERLMTDGADKPLFALHFWTPQRGMVVGAYGLALMTEDGGAHWQWVGGRIPNPKGLHLYGLWAREDQIYLVGEQGMVLRSGDGGRQFQVLSTPYAGSYFGVTSTSRGNRPELAIYGLRGHAFRIATATNSIEGMNVGVQASVLSMLPRVDGGTLLFDADGQVVELAESGRDAKVLGSSPVGPVLGAVSACGGKLVVAGLRGLAAVDPVAMTASGKGVWK